MNRNILSTSPLVQKYDNFLSPEECNALIEFARPKLVAGMIVGNDGKEYIDYAHRTASSAHISSSDDFPVRDAIFDRVTSVFSIDKSRFEGMTIIHYDTGEEFKVHQDYFVDIDDEAHRAATAKRCEKGGNRVSTLVFYLNDVERGGETYFPWLDIVSPATAGGVIHFDYGYDDWRLNIRSQHAGMPVLSGEKWIMTIWVREADVTQGVSDYRKFKEESDIYTNIRDIEYNLDCGPDDDRKTLSFIIPANTDPMKTIIVGFTGGMDSSLVLYLTAMLNNMQEIPYIIQPVCVTSKLCEDTEKIAEDWDNVELMYNLINDKVGNTISKVAYISAPPDTPRHLQVRRGLERFFYTSANLDIHRFQKYEYIYMGDNALPPDPDFPGIDTVVRYTRKAPLPWMNCLINLYKYHIVDALLQLGCQDIIENTSRCVISHSTLEEPCVSFQCNERRWAFTKINKELGTNCLTDKG